MIKYTNYTTVKRTSVGGLKSYYFTTVANHICCVYGTKWLRFNSTTHILSLSTDGGSTYNINLDLTGVSDIIAHSRIFEDGVIGWSDHTHCYYSEDNLATYHLSTIIDVHGTTWTPIQAHDNFKCAAVDYNTVITGKGIMHVWGVYTIEEGTDVNIWYTRDSFRTIKSCFKDTVTIPGQDARHVEGVFYNRDENKFWAEWGDGVLCALNKGTYDWDSDIWSWTEISHSYSITTASGLGGGPDSSSGFAFYDDYFFWAQDGGANGVWKAKNVDLQNWANWTHVRTSIYAAGTFHGSEKGILIVSDYSHNSVLLSYDKGISWENINLTGGPDLGGANSGYYFGCIGPDDNNWFRHEIQENMNNEPDYLSPLGITLMMQILPSIGSN